MMREADRQREGRRGKGDKDFRARFLNLFVKAVQRWFLTYGERQFFQSDALSY